MRIVVLALIVKVFLSQLSQAKSHVSNTQHLTLDNNCFMMIDSNPHRTRETQFTGQDINYKSRNVVDEENESITKQKRDEILFNDQEMSINYWSENLRLQQTNPTEHSSMLDLYKVFFSGSFKIIYHYSRTDSLFIKLLLLFVIRLLLKGSCQIELQFLSFAFLNLDLSFATLISPSPSFSMTSWQTSSISSHVGSHLNATQLGRLVASSSAQVSSNVKTEHLESLKTANKLSYAERGDCDMGWIQFGKYCYFPSTEPMIFDHAQRACSYRAANLISITNKSENDLIFNISRDYFGLPKKTFVWLGMERRESTSKLHWIDKNDLNYQNWILGEPDANGACVQMIMEGLWEDCTCMEKKYFICKKRTSYPPPYSRSTELGILIGIPFTFAFIVLFVVTILIFKSIRDADDTFYGYGKNRNKEKMHAAIVNVTASIAHVKAEKTSSHRNEASQRKPTSRSSSRSQSLSSSRVNPAVDVPDIDSQSPVPQPTNPKIKVCEAEAQSHDNLGVDVYDILNFPIQNRKNLNGHRSVPAEARGTVDLEEIELQACGSAVSLDKEPSRFQSTTSLDHLVSKSYIKPKSRKLRGLRKPEAIIRPPGKDGVYRKKTSV